MATDREIEATKLWLENNKAEARDALIDFLLANNILLENFTDYAIAEKYVDCDDYLIGRRYIDEPSLTIGELNSRQIGGRL